MHRNRPESGYNSRNAEGQATPSVSNTSPPSLAAACPNTARARRRFHIEIRLAALHATTSEHQHLELLVTLERQGHITLTDAQHCVTALIDQQQPARHAA
jgi:hypothetical protein